MFALHVILIKTMWAELVGTLSQLVCVNRHKNIFKSLHSGTFLIKLSPPANGFCRYSGSRTSNHDPTLSDVHHLEQMESQGTNLVHVK